MAVSHETIYTAIYAYPRGALKQSLIEAPRQGKPSRGRRRRTLAKGSMVPPDLQIVHRPENVETRARATGKATSSRAPTTARPAARRSSARPASFVLSRMRGCGADAALAGFTRQMKKRPAFLRQRLAYDRASQLARHAELASG